MHLTPSMPKDWWVHHMYQAHPPIANRFKMELGIDVHDAKYLRGVDPKLHDEIDDLQRKFWRKQLKTYGPRVYFDTPMDEIVKFYEQIDETYKDLYVKVGASSAEVQRIQRQLSKPRFFQLGKPVRINKTLRRAGIPLGALGGFSSILENATFAKNIVAPPDRVQRALDEFLFHYATAYEEALTRGYVDKNTWYHLEGSLRKYMNAADFPDEVKSNIEQAMIREYVKK